MADGERRETARTAPGARGAAAPWVRARLRTSAAGSLAMGLLVLVTAFLAAAVPRQTAAQEDEELRQALAGAPLERRSVTVTADVHHVAVRDGYRLPGPAALEEGARALRDAARPPLAPDRDRAVNGIRTKEPVTVDGHGLPRPSGIDPQLTLHTAPLQAERHLRLVSGRMPSPTVREDTVEAVVTERTAKTMNLKTGSTVVFPDVTGTPVTVRVSGVAAPRDPDSAHWRIETDLLEPSLRAVPTKMPPPLEYWHFTALIDSGAREVLLRCDGGAAIYGHHPLRVGDVTAANASALLAALVSLSSGADEARLRDRSPLPDPDVDADGPAGLLEAFEQERATSRALVTTAVVGVGTAAAVVLVLAGVLTVTARRPELELLRARGGSLPGIGLRLLGETSAVAVPAAAAGTAAALLWVPAPGVAASLAMGAAVALAACLTLPLLAVAAHRRPGPPVRGDVAAARPSRRRTVAELTVVALASGGLVAVRRGTGAGPGAGTAVDPLTAAAPVLPAVVAAVVLLRVYPLPLRLSARPAARLRGLVLPLALARLGRAPAASVLPLLAMVVALTVSAFGGSVLAGVTAGRAHAALAEVGADARVEVPGVFPEDLEERLRRVEGVSGTSAVRIENGRSLKGVRAAPFALVAVDPETYARLTARTGLDGDGPFPAGELGRAGGEGAAVPAVVSPGLAEALGEGGEAEVDAVVGDTPVRAVAVRGRTPAVTGEFAVVSSAAFAGAHPDRRGSHALRPTTVLVSGTGLDGRALRAAAGEEGEDVTVTVRAEREAGYESGPLQDGTRLVHAAAVAAGIGYGALALLLWLLQSAPGRRTLLARLRAMGASRGQGRALVWAETLPLAVLGVVGGAVAAPATVALLRPGVDLTPLAFTAQVRAAGEETVRAALVPDAGSLVWPSLLLLALTCVVAAVQAGTGGVREEAERLRTGERE
ncbi:ABC transporter permease [Streptomyces desertarenae]|uniref:ABC transporter permease n=1 Tax=Streptomyces desertarenae TaxID=2666184 RepID=A0ABW4PIR5_9ACTN